VFNILFLATIFLNSKEPLTRTTRPNIDSLVLNNLEQSLIVDERGFYPSKLYINSNTSVNLKIANLLNKDLTFTNSNLNIYTAIKPKSSNNIIFKINKTGLYEFNCAINKLTMHITVD